MANPYHSTDLTVISSGSTVFDTIALLDRFSNHPVLAAHICRSFLTHMPDNLLQLDQALQNQDAHGVIGQLHSIKGAAANVGGNALMSLAQTLETQAKDGNLQVVQTQRTQLTQAFEQLQSAIHIWLDQVETETSNP